MGYHKSFHNNEELFKERPKNFILFLLISRDFDSPILIQILQNRNKLLEDEDGVVIAQI